MANETLATYYDFIDRSETKGLIDKIDRMTDDHSNGSVMSALIYSLMVTHLSSLEDGEGSVDPKIASQYLVELSQTLRVIQDSFFD